MNDLPPVHANPELIRAVPQFASFARALVILTKPRLAFFSILSAMSVYAATNPGLPLVHTIATLLGTTLAAGGALSLNQWWERDTDALMRRTCHRPLPTQTLPAPVALCWSLLLSISGVGLLLWQINPAAAALAAATIVVYGLIYTPMKRRARWATEIGSLSGALPALLGAAAAGDLLSPPGWILAGILLFWQMPHFYAIGWRYRADYQAAGLPLLPATDPTGRQTARWSLGYSLILAVISLIPWLTGTLGHVYGVVALIANAYFLWNAARFHAAPSERDANAKRLFLASIIYLPAIMTALALARLLP